MKHKSDRFQGQLNLIRWEHSPQVALFVSGKDLSLASDFIDLDSESDVIIEKLKNQPSDNKRHAFEYHISTGFKEVDPDEQTWFNFK